MNLRTVAALYIDPRGPYPAMAGVIAWGLPQRDARCYRASSPIVAHPPCGPWSQLRHMYKGEEQDCALVALRQVRRAGGVLEHPAGSKLWEHDAVLAEHIGRFGLHVDRFGGFCMAVNQVEWGHVAQKRTWLYLVEVPRHALLPAPYPGRKYTHWLSGSRGTGGRNAKGTGGGVPEGIKVCSAQQRRRTPLLFAEYLVHLARAAKT